MLSHLIIERMGGKERKENRTQNKDESETIRDWSPKGEVDSVQNGAESKKKETVKITQRRPDQSCDQQNTNV